MEIPCTFERPSKRRGPPNRLAESIKKQRIESPAASGHSIPSSPTHAAHTLASFAQQQVLSADAICPWPVLQLLIDDYFTYIHPLIPVPHEPSFRSALEHRQDLTSPTFLALMASMIGSLTASFPRRPRQHFKAQGLVHMFPNSTSLIERCQKVAVEAHGPATFNRAYTVHDAIISYLQGLTNIHTWQRLPAMLYFKECLSIITTLGLHKAEQGYSASNGLGADGAVLNGIKAEAQNPAGMDLIVNELGKRIFWVLFVGVRSLQQLGVSPFELNIPPPTKLDPYPPLPVEIDDDFLTPTQILQQPDGRISELVGFNINARIYTSYSSVSLNEMNYGVDELVDWERQRREIEESLDNVKRILESLPAPLVLDSTPKEKVADPAHHPDASTAMETKEGAPAPTNNGYDDRASMQREIQKANIQASQIGTRSYLVERFFALSNAHHHASNSASDKSNGNDTSNNSMSAEHSSITTSLLDMLLTIQQTHLEPNGASLIAKLRAIASTLLDVPDPRKGTVALKAESPLSSFAAILGRLEKTVGASDYTHEEDEERRTREWTNLRHEQARLSGDGVISGEGGEAGATR